jgi:hypothetical protein
MRWCQDDRIVVVNDQIAMANEKQKKDGERLHHMHLSTKNPSLSRQRPSQRPKPRCHCVAASGERAAAKSQ